MTAEAGRLGTPPLLAIARRDRRDRRPSPRRHGRATARHAGRGHAARSPTPTASSRSDRRRPASGSSDRAASRAAVDIDASTLGESTEGSLVTRRRDRERQARRRRRAATSRSSWTPPAVTIRIVADASSGLTATSVVVGATYDVTGVAGQRASRKGALDGYRIWLRDARDLVKRAAARPPRRRHRPRRAAADPARPRRRRPA